RAGGAFTTEGPAPGSLMTPCSHWTRFYGHPAYRDFDLAAEGLRYVFPEQNEGMIFDDRSSFIGYSPSPGGGAAPGGPPPRRRPLHAAARGVRAALEAGLPPASLQPAAAMGHARPPRGAARGLRQPDRARAPAD